MNYQASQSLSRASDCNLFLPCIQLSVQGQVKLEWAASVDVCTPFTYQPWLHSFRKLLFKSIHVIPFHHQLWPILKFHLEETQKSQKFEHSHCYLPSPPHRGLPLTKWSSTTWILYDTYAGMHTATDFNQNLTNPMTVKIAQQVLGYSCNTWHDNLAGHFNVAWTFVLLEACKAWCTLTKQRKAKPNLF